MKKVQTKLILLCIAAIGCLSILAGILLRGVYVEYAGLADFKQTTQVSVTAYDLARNLTAERQMAYQASAFLGEGTPQQMYERYDASIAVTRKTMANLRRLAEENRQRFSSAFQKGLDEAIAAEEPLNQIRAEILDPKRSQDKDAATIVKTKALRIYDIALFSQANFLPILAVETQDAELVRKITTQDGVARLQKDFWKIKGLMGTVLRDSKITDLASGELKTKRLAADDHVSRLLNLSDKNVSKAVQNLISNEDYAFIINSTGKILDMGSKATDFSAFGTYANYQSGPFKRVEAQFDILAAEVTRSISDYTSTRLKDAGRHLLVLAIFSVVTVIGLALFILYIARSVTLPLRNLSEQLTHTASRGMDSSKMIAGLSMRLSEDACEEAAALQEISASVEELASMTNSNLEHMRVMSGLASKAAQSTDDGKGNVAKLSEAMAGIQKTNNDIANILKTIDEIAFQTNILALNAAVEAARAGEAGAGFAVVADEVRTLAQRSAQAAQETRSKIELALKSNTNGAEITRQVEQRFAEISSLTKEYHAKVNEVESASSQSSEGLVQVRDAISRLDQITQRTAAAAEENASASAEMSTQVENIFRYIETLESMVSTLRPASNKKSDETPPAEEGPALTQSVPVEAMTEAGE